MTAKQLALIIIVLAIGRALLYFFPGIDLINEKLKKITVEYLDSVAIAGVTALFIIHFIVRTFYIPSGSMIPTLQVRDFILVNEFIYRFKEPERGDIIVFKPPPEAHAGDKEFIKRVIGLPGDTISIEDGKVYVNGKPLEEPYVKFKPDYYFAPRTVPRGHLFVMGDNRPSSADSHIWGFLPRENILGKASLIILPPTRVKVLR